MIIASDQELSFWGGVDPRTGTVIDQHHPLCGQVLTGTVLAIPGGRGSCSGSGVMLELLLNGKGPAALLLERADDILTLGVVVAEAVFGQSIPVVTLAPEDFQQVRVANRARVSGNLVAYAGKHGALADLPASTCAPAAKETGIQLSDRDQALLEGAHGRAARVAMEILLRMAALQGARELVDVTRVHVDGCLYTGPGGLQFAQQLRDWGGQVAVPTTLNAISVDYRHWRTQGMDPTFGEPASQLADAYASMGAMPTFTCAPYQLDEPPAHGEQIAWAESNAVIYANSVLGARTLKYPDYLDICVALTGRAPLAGCHSAEHRRAQVRIRLPTMTGLDDAFYPLLGHHVGMLAGDRVPLVTGLERAEPSADDLKAFSAAFATTASTPMFHMLGVTPEAITLEQVLSGLDAIPTVNVTPAELRASWANLDSATHATVDLVSLGNPHFSFQECERLATLVRDRTKHQDMKVVVTCGRNTHDRARRAGLVRELEAFGVEFVTDTCWCMIIEPLIPPAAVTIMTNSAKYAHYGPGLTGRAFRFGSLDDCVEAACTGQADHDLPPWLAPSRENRV